MILSNILLIIWGMTDDLIVKRAQEVFGPTFASQEIHADTYFVLSQSLQDPKEMTLLNFKWVMMQIPKKKSIIFPKTKGRWAVNPCCFRENNVPAAHTVKPCDAPSCAVAMVVNRA